MKTKYFVSFCHSLLLIYVEAICETERSKKNIGVNCYAYWPDGSPIWKGNDGTKINDRCGGDKVTNFPGDCDENWGGGGRRDSGGKGGDNSERKAYGGKMGYGWAKGTPGKKRGDRGGKGPNFPPGGRGGGNIKQLESPDYDPEDDD